MYFFHLFSFNLFVCFSKQHIAVCLFFILVDNLCLLTGTFIVLTFTAEILVPTRTTGVILDSALPRGAVRVIYQHMLWTPPPDSVQAPKPFSPPSLVKLIATSHLVAQ